MDMRCCGKISIAAVLALGLWAGGAAARDADIPFDADLDELLERLSDPAVVDWEAIDDRIRQKWSKSGSAAMDLLLKRGREALEKDDHVAALDHLGALVDHAPDFAEGYNARALAYFAMKRYGEAIHDIRRALELNPDHYGALAGLGIIMEDLGYHGEALEAFRAAHRLNPHREDVGEAINRLERQTVGVDI